MCSDNSSLESWVVPCNTTDTGITRRTMVFECFMFSVTSLRHSSTIDWTYWMLQCPWKCWSMNKWIQKHFHMPHLAPVTALRIEQKVINICTFMKLLWKSHNTHVCHAEFSCLPKFTIRYLLMELETGSNSECNQRYLGYWCNQKVYHYKLLAETSTGYVSYPFPLPCLDYGYVVTNVVSCRSVNCHSLVLGTVATLQP